MDIELYIYNRWNAHGPVTRGVIAHTSGSGQEVCLRFKFYGVSFVVVGYFATISFEICTLIDLIHVSIDDVAKEAT